MFNKNDPLLPSLGNTDFNKYKSKLPNNLIHQPPPLPNSNDTSLVDLLSLLNQSDANGTVNLDLNKFLEELLRKANSPK